ncbi:MAG: efflux RND transporter periplasmic adaptor subunit [Microscillaceae bacterium]
MIRRIFIGILLVLFVAVSIWLGFYFYNKSKQDPIVYKTESPFITNIVQKTVATGSIVPRREVAVKPQASGIIEEVYVEAGEQVTKGQLIARVKFVQGLSGQNADQISLNNARNSVETARINMNNAKIELERQQKLYEQKVISQQEYNRFLLDYNVQKEAFQAAQNNLGLVRQGILQNSGAITNEIYAPIAGLVLDVPVKVGTSVIERNNFNEGTTIATIADMNSIVFEGKIDESEVGKLKEGMELKLNIGAIEGKTFRAVLEYIAPKGVTEEGAIKFDIRAKIILEKDDFIRAGYSANADIVLDKRNKVLAVKESMLQFAKQSKNSKDSTFVEVETSKQQFKKRYIRTGISDGINIEVVSGLDKKDKIKVPLSKEGEGPKPQTGS